MCETGEIKEWQTQSVRTKIAAVLIQDGISFSYDEENGIMFAAPDLYVERLKERLVCSYGCRRYPEIHEIKSSGHE